MDGSDSSGVYAKKDRRRMAVLELWSVRSLETSDLVLIHPHRSGDRPLHLFESRPRFWSRLRVLLFTRVRAAADRFGTAAGFTTLLRASMLSALAGANLFFTIATGLRPALLLIATLLSLLGHESVPQAAGPVASDER